MSTTIDNKVVEMRFDNKQFEKNVQTSIHTLDKLDKSLRLEDASKGFESVEKAAKKVDLNPLASAVKTVRIEFSAMQVMAISALKNITDSAMRSAKKIASALTIDPVKTGLHEYETQINATQTILSNTQKEGATINDVNAALDELNKYADLTIYNFTEMTKNIGTFTAAGVDLKTSVSAIQGIANLAAVSGSTSQQASTAMYQLSQALASGTVKLMDWNSVVNAGMGGQVFQDALKDTARQHGIAIDKMIKKQGSFRETLKNGWLTSEILTETLSKFTTSGVNEYLAKNSDLTIKSIETMRREAVATGDSSKAFKEMAKTIAATSKISEDEIYNLLKMSQTAEEAATKVKTFSQLWDVLKEAAQSGWSASWRTIVGDYEEAKETLTEFSDTLTAIISESADKRNKKLVEGLSSGWKQLLNEGISNSLDFQDTVIATAKEYGIAINDIIDRTGSFEKSLKEGWINSEILAVSVSKLAEKTSDLSDKELENLGYTRDQAEALEELNTKIQNGSLNLDEFVEKMSKASGRENLIDAIRNTFNFIMSIVKPVKEAFEEVFGTTGKQIYDLTQKIKDFTSRLKINEETASKIKSTFKGLFSVIDIIRQAFGAVFRALKPLLGLFVKVGDGVLDVTSSFGDWITALAESIRKNEVFIKIADGVASVLSEIVSFIKPAISAIGKFASTIVKNFGAAINTVKEWVEEFLKLPQVTKAISGIRNVFSNIFGWLGNKFSEAGTAFSGFIERVKGLNGLTLENVGKALSDFWNNVVKPFFNFETIFQKISDTIKKFKENVGNWFKKIGEEADKVKGKLVDLVTGVLQILRDNWQMISSILSAVALYKFVKSLSKLTTAIESLVMPLKSIGDGVVGVLTSVRSAIDAWKTNQKAKNLLYLAGAIGILALSLALITQLPYEKLAVAAGLLLVFGGALTGFAYLLSKMDMSGLSAWTIVAFAGSLFILVTALKKIEDLGDFYSAWTKLGALALMLTVFVGVLSKIAPKLSTNAIALWIFAIALNSLIGVIAKIGKIDLSGIKISLESVGSVFLGLIGLALVIRLAGKYMIRAGVGLIAVGWALSIIAGSIRALAEIPPKIFAQGMEAIETILKLFALILAVTSLVGGKNVGKAGLGILAMSAAIMLLVWEIKILGSTDQATIRKGKKVVYEMLALFAGIVVLSQYAGQHAAKAGVMLLAMSAAIAIMTVPIALLSILDPSGLKRAMSAIRQVSLCFALLIKSTHFARGVSIKNSSKDLIVMTFAIGLIAIAIGALSQIEGSKLQNAANALSQVMALFAIMITSTHFAKQATSSIAFMTVAVGMLGVVLYMLGQLPAESVLASAKALTDVMLALTAAFVIISNTKEFGPGTLKNLGTMVLVTIALGAIIGILAYLNVGPTLEIAASLSLMLLAFSSACVILGVVGMMGPAVNAGLLVLGKLVAGSAVILGLFAGLAALFPGLGDALDKGIDLLRKVGEGLGAVIGGFLAGVLSGLPQIGTYLSDFMTNAESFVNGIKNIGSDTLEGAKTLAETILIFTGASILDGIASLFGGHNNMTGFAASLAMFGNAMGAFAKSTEGIDAEKVKPAAEAAKLLAEMAAALPNSGGLVGLIVGENDMDDFAAMLPLFGMALMKFSNSVSGIDESAVKAGAEAGKLVAEMAAALPNSGGIVGLFAGNNDMDDFAGQMVLFGMALVKFSNSCEGISLDNIKAGSEAGTLVSEMASTISNSGGLVSLILGDNTMSDFAAQLVLFAGAIERFSNASANIKIQNVINGTTAGFLVTKMAKDISSINVQGTSDGIYSFAGDLALFALALSDFSEASTDVDISAVEKNAGVATRLREILPSIREFLECFTDEKYGFYGNTYESSFNPDKLKQFNEGIVLLGEGLKSFSESCSGIRITAYAVGVAAAGKLVEINNSLFGTGGVIQWFGGEKDLHKFSEGITLLGSALSEFCTDVSGENINPEAAQKAIDIVAKLEELNDSLASSGGLLQKLIGEKDLNRFSSSLTQLSSALKDFCADVSSGNVSVESAEQGIALAETLIADYNDLEPAVYKDFNGFSTGVSALGLGIQAFSDAMVNVKPESVSKGVTAIESLTGLYGVLGETGGLFSIFTGTKNLDDFSNKLGTLGTGVADFATNVKDINPYITKSAAEACIYIGEALQSINEYTGMPSSIGMILRTLGEGLKDYYDDVANIDVSRFLIITSAVDELILTIAKLTGNFEQRIKDFSSGLEELAGIGVDSFLGAVESAKERSAEIAKGMIDNFISGATAQTGNFKTAFTYVIQNGLAAISSRASEFKTAGHSLMSSFILGITSGVGDVKNGFNSVIDGIKTVMKSGIQDFNVLGRSYVQGFASGLKNSTYLATIEARAMAKAVDDAVRDKLGIHSPSKKGEEIGGFYNQGIGAGLKGSKHIVTKEAYNVARALDDEIRDELGIHSPGKKGEEVGEGHDMGIAVGLVNGKKFIYKGLENVTNFINDESTKGVKTILNNIKDASTKNISATWADVSKANEKGSKEATSKLNVSMQKALSGINPFTGKLREDASDSIMFVESREERFAKRNSALAKEIENSWTESAKNIEKEEGKSSKRRNSNSKKAGKQRIEEQKKITEESIKVERSYWQRMLELQKEAEAVKADETTSIFSELSNESDSKTKKKNKDLTKILQERMDLTEKYLKIRTKLESRLKGSKLWNYVSTLGEDSLSDLETLNNMTEEKLKEYANLYEKYFALGIEKAKTVLSESDLKTYQEKVLEDTKSTIKTYQDEIKKLTDNFVQKSSIFDPFEQKEGIASQTLMNNLDARITYFEEYSRIRNSLQNKLENNETSLWEDVVKDLGMDDIATLKALDNMSIQDLNTYSWKYQKLLLEGKNLAVRDAKKTKEETEKTLSELYGTPIDLDEFLSVYDGTFESIDYYVVMKAKQSGSNFVTDFSAGITENTSKATDSAKEMTDKTVAKADDISKEKSPAVGANLVQGFANGITDNSYIAEAAASAVATNAINAANNTLGIASPSKVMYGSGRYTIMGFVSGLLDFAQDVYSAGSEVGKQAKDGLLSSMSNIASLVDGSMEYRPTIRPVLDLSNVETGSRQLSSLFSSDQAMKISASMKREDETKNQNGSEKQSSSTVYQFTQNNYSPKALSRLDIYRQTKNQFSTLKGLV